MTASELRPLTLERVRDIFDAAGWNYEPAQSGHGLRTGFYGLGMEIRFLAPTLTVLTTVAVDAVTAEQFDDVLGWVENYNDTHAFPTASAIQDTERDLTALAATYALPGNWEYTDEQLAQHVSSGIEGVGNAARDFLQHFAPEVLAKIDAQLPKVP